MIGGAASAFDARETPLLRILLLFRG